MDRLFKHMTMLASMLALTATMRAQEPAPADSVPDNPDFELLDEVVITGKTPLVRTEADKVIYDMEQDPSAQTSTVLDAMRKVPLLTVDADGNIKLKGESNFKIYINGKHDPAFSQNYKDIFKAMPASSIKNIEVITQPGAKYDAEGVGGIINIVTERSSKIDGYSATVNVSGGNNMANVGVNALAKFNKVSLNLNYSHGWQLNQTMKQRSTTEYLNNPVEHLYEVRTKLKPHTNFDFGNMSASWEPNDKNLFTMNGNLFYAGTDFNSVLNYNMYSQDNTQQWGYRSRADFNIKYFNYTVGANWQHNFNSPEHNIVFLYQYGRQRNRDDRSYIYEDYVNYPEPIPASRANIVYPNNEHTFQVDYTLPFLTHHTFETGAKYIMRRNSGHSEHFAMPDGADNWIYSPEGSLDMKQHQDVVAGYVAYTGKFSSWIFKGGVRYEYAHLSSRFLTPGYKDFSQNLNDVVPNAMISYTMPDYSNFSLAYQMRIMRPTMEQLNPYRNYSTPVSVEYGNPELISQKSNNLNLTYTNFSLPVQINISLSYTYTDKMILQYMFLDADNVTNSTYGNYGHCNQGGAYAYLAYPIMSGMRLSVNGGVNYAAYKSLRADVNSHGWGWNVGGDFSWQMPRDWELSLYGGAGKSAVDFQSTGSVWSYHGLGITKSLLKEKRLRLTLSANGIFTPKRKFTYTTTTADVINRNVSRFNAWSVGLAVSYRIGSFNASVKKTSKSINNDDVNHSQSTPGSMPGGGGR